MRGSFIVVLLLAAGAVPAPAQSAPQPSHRSALGMVAHAAGGVLLGAWTGYVTSQVAWSDWRDPAGRNVHRLRFSISGAGLGLIAGALIGSRRTEARGPLVAPPVTPGPITGEDIVASPARTLTELLRALRPQWLRSRGADVLRFNADPLAAHGVRVYLNGALLGGLETLDQVSIYAITGVEFFDAAAATLRWGAGHADGAILLITNATP